MTVIISGSSGITNVDGSAAAPSETGADTNTGVFYPAADTVGVSTGGTERMRVDSSGNVGIGTASPTQKLELNSGFVKVGNGVGGGGGVWFPYSSDASGRTWRARTDIVGYGDFGFEQSTTQTGTTFATKFLIDASGNVGIGTASPAYKLDVSGAATATPVTNGIIRILTTGSNPPTGYGGGLVFSQVDSGAVNRDYASITGSRVNSSANNQVDMVFSTGDPGGGSVPVAERMRITTGGNLLVGTTTTAGKLTVNSGSLGVQAIGVGDGTIDASATGIVQITRPATNDTKFGLCFVRNGNQTAGIGFAASSNTFVVVNGANNSSNGMTLAVGGTSWGTQSDERKKNILGNIENALEKISSLRTVFFEYKNDEYKTRKVGFIAQDVQTVLPEAVHVGDDPDNTLNLQYSDVIPLLTAAIQEQQALITALTTRIEALENK